MAKFQITSNFLDEKSDSCAKVDIIWAKLYKGFLIFSMSIHGFLRIDLSYWCLWLGTEWVQSASPVSIALIHLLFPLWSQFSSFSCINCQAIYQKLCAPTMHLYFPGVRDIQKTLPLRNAENLVKHANLIFLKDNKTTKISRQQQQKDYWR